MLLGSRLHNKKRNHTFIFFKSVLKGETWAGNIDLGNISSESRSSCLSKHLLPQPHIRRAQASVLQNPSDMPPPPQTLPTPPGAPRRCLHYLNIIVKSALPSPDIKGYPAVRQRHSEECLGLPVKCNPRIYFPSEEVRVILISGNLETNSNCSYRERKSQIQDECCL
ncbi:hypothetical protein MJT46_009087 [Ovis ammon polii x Ovis aries]|nr:hypothetical protein MJT46_009087 [Ovis ammon polii x Ovis aries]